MFNLVLKNRSSLMLICGLTELTIDTRIENRKFVKYSHTLKLRGGVNELSRTNSYQIENSWSWHSNKDGARRPHSLPDEDSSSPPEHVQPNTHTHIAPMHAYLFFPLFLRTAVTSWIIITGDKGWAFLIYGGKGEISIDQKENGSNYKLPDEWTIGFTNRQHPFINRIYCPVVVRVGGFVFFS